MGDVSAVRRRRAVTVWLLSLALVTPAVSAGCGAILDEDPSSAGAGGGPSPAAAAVATQTSGPDAYERSGRAGDFRLVLPGPETAGPYPLVIALHSLYHDGSETTGWGLEQLARTAGFAMVSPDGVGKSWNAGTCCDTAVKTGVDDVAWLHALIQHLKTNYPIDPARVIIIGLSNGGMMAYRYACEHPEDLAGIAVVAGSLQQLDCRPDAPVSVVSVHGGKDGHVPAAGADWQPTLGTPVTSTARSLLPFREVARCPTTTGLGDVMGTGADGAPRLSDTLSAGGAAVTPVQIRAALASLGLPAPAGVPAPATPSAGVTAPALVPVDPATSPAYAIRTETTCATGARVVDYYLPDADHGWPGALGPSAFATASVIWQLLGSARAHPAR
ncbi:prolyl oligopeptidase family serine peptidase [Frankia sp. CNm7]|uniref:Prolyl oligopeptidase family serine peptidase n=1 Tax=Frankia nepalensis TaxID=1836974 RepID=A0A937URG6_9ACTN|nr:PHB depolymerase family esterase [Frankia nepalensis]MBL7495375.1 prolyl oligopeptidase family serine peptidase [Frankia nepalensis]MBL7515862.1 prolyl oligopeptidase family serine peptidase [Frankia nepalensis]MBL7518760.1 prolyl oligopeptidase family serine peptidase [Frankia nepalensis]MBL7627736.1 prolyl oligopeptidase family serine peptidase [Frankia nepalensis]